MKHTVFLIMAMMFSYNAVAQFGAVQLIETNIGSGGIRQFIKSADLNNDGFSEVIVGADISNTIRIYQNNGDLNFSPAVALVGNWQQIADIEVGDLDANGFIDIMSLDRQTGKLFWHPNTNGVFGNPVVLDAGLEITFGRILYAEFTGDGIKDIIILAHHDVLLYAASGNGTFSTAISLIPLDDQTEFYDAAYGDFNGDGFMDFAITSTGFNIYLNNGTGNFTFNATVGNGISFTICSADFNDDGLSDMVMRTNQLKLFLNTPSGFASPVLFDLNNENFKSLRPADLDGDGDIDLLTQSDQVNKVVWYKNDSVGNFGLQQLLYAQTGIGSFNAVQASDLDNDGDLEPIWSASNGFVAFHDNTSPLAVPDFLQPSPVLFPNPVNDELHISSGDRMQSVTIYNIVGQRVAVHLPNDTVAQINLPKLPSGCYFARIVCGSNSSSHSFVKR